MTFEALAVKPEVVRALTEMGITTPTTIQEISIPLIHDGKDVVGMSRTGSGKTAAFGIPLVDLIDPPEGLQILILAPTRELAVQIAGEMQKFGKYLDFNVATIFGGVGYEPQIAAMRTAHIVVGTPGRILDHIGQRNLDLSKVTRVVLDEADKMVDMGFFEDVSKILDETPDGRQVLLFGATISSEIKDIQKKYMHDPATAQAEIQVEKDLLEQYYFNIQTHEKFSLLVHLLKSEETQRVIIFCSSIATVDLIDKNLKRHNIKAGMLHGKMMQNKRMKMIEDFNNDKVPILIASAVAARGLHINDVSHVINYDLSRDPQEYIHRVGRTARAGQSGKALTLLSDKDYAVFQSVLDRYPIHITKLDLPPFQKLRFDASRNDTYGHGKNDRFGRGRAGYRGDGNTARREGPRVLETGNRFGDSADKLPGESSYGRSDGPRHSGPRRPQGHNRGSRPHKPRSQRRHN